MSGLIRILDAIKKQIDAIAKHADACEKADKTKSPDTVPVIEVQFPVEVSKKYYAEQNKGYGLQKWGFWVGVLTLISLIVYTVITYHQWQAMLDSNRTNRDALVSVQRAFISVGPIESIRASDGTFTIRFRWDNSGATPTKTMSVHVSYRPQNDAIGPNFDFSDVWLAGEPHVNREFAVGPHANAGSIVGPVTPEMIKMAQDHKIHLYFWGTAKYRDIFPDTPYRITEFCAELTGWRGDPLNMKEATGSIEPIFAGCPYPYHNCNDEQCSDYQSYADSPIVGRLTE